MHVRAFLVHVEDAVIRAVIDNAKTRPPFAAPDAAIAGAGAHFRLAQSALVETLLETVGGSLAAVDGARLHLRPIRRQVIEPYAKGGVDVFLQHVGAGVDMGVGVVDTKSVAHRSPPWCRTASMPLPLRAGNHANRRRGDGGIGSTRTGTAGQAR